MKAIASRGTAALALQSLAAALTRSHAALLKSAMTDALDTVFAEAILAAPEASV